MKEMLLLNTGFQENKPFYEIYARDHVISELTDPVRDITILFDFAVACDAYYIRPAHNS